MDNRLRDLRREAEALLERITAAEVATPGLLRPLADIHELAGHYVLEVELPGVRPGEVQVYSQHNCLIVEGLKPSPDLPKGFPRPVVQKPLPQSSASAAGAAARAPSTSPSGEFLSSTSVTTSPRLSTMTPVSYQCLERQYGPFRRIFSLPGPCDLSQTRAELAGGLLTIIIPTLSEDRRSQRRPVPIAAHAPVAPSAGPKQKGAAGASAPAPPAGRPPSGRRPSRS